MIDEIHVSRSLTRLVDLLVEACDEHGEMRAEHHQVLTSRDANDRDLRKYEIGIARARARRDTAREALLIALGIDPHHGEAPF